MGKSEIFDTSAVIEGFRGTITIFTVLEHPPAADCEEILYPDKIDYIKAVEIAERLRKKGTPIGAADVMIAAISLNRAATLVTKDNNFKFVQHIYPDFELKFI